MKRMFFITVFLLSAGFAVFAQQAAAANPSSSQTKQNAQQYLNQAKSNAQQYESTLQDLKARNLSNKDAYTFNRLKGEIDKLESSIDSEEKSISTILDRGTKVTTEVMDRIERMIGQHKAKVDELDKFISN